MDDNRLWAVQLAAATRLSDSRHNTRLGIILETFANQPTDSIPQASDNWGQTKAVYRFLDNPQVAPEVLDEGAARRTAQLCRQSPVVLAVQDTTSINLSANDSIAELGPIDSKNLAHGLLLHTTLAVTEQGSLVGILGQQFWARARPGQPGPKPEKAAEDRESTKWINGIDQARQALHEGGEPGPRIIHVMDREGDVYDVMQWIDDQGDSAVIRSVQNRLVEGPLRLAHDTVRDQAVLERKRIEVPRSHGCATRKALVELRTVTTTLVPNLHKNPHGWPMAWTLVEVWEPDPPERQQPLHWLLWTREPALTAVEAWEVVRKYTYRWRIEEFHLTLKSGCRIEELQLETWPRLLKALMLYSVVAARIVSLRDLSRTEPDAPATVLLSEDECKVLWARCGKGKPELGSVLTLRQAVLWIGRLGGHLNRKADGMPGVRTLWRGMQDLGLLVKGYQAAKRELE